MGGVDPLVVAVPVEDPVPVEAPVEDPVPVEAPVGAGSVDPGVVLVPDAVLDVVSPGIPPAVVGVPVPEEIDVLDVEFAVELSLGVVAPSAGPLGLAPPGLIPAEMPPVESGARLCTTVVVVVDVESLVLAAVESELGSRSLAAGETCGRVGELTIGSVIARDGLAEDVTAAGWAAGPEAGAILTARARWC